MKFSQSNHSTCTPLIVACTLLALSTFHSMSPVASAALINVDFNDAYSPGDLNTQNPVGDGLGAWAGSAEVDIVSGDLVPTSPPLGYVGQSGTGQRAAGQLLTASGQEVGATLDTPMTSNDLWFSFLLNRGSTNARGGIDLHGAGGEVRVIDVAGSLRMIGSISATLSSSITIGTTHFILGQVIVDDSGDETMNLWLDPADLDSLGGASLSGTGDFITSTGLLSIDVESYGSDGATDVDFIVLAGSQSELFDFLNPPPAPVPEPASFLLLGLGAWGLIRHTQRRRKA